MHLTPIGNPSEVRRCIINHIADRGDGQADGKRRCSSLLFVYIQFMDDSGAENLSNEAHWEREYHSSVC
jgi:hypothetical protein